MKRLLQHSILFSLLAFAGLTACYQPIDLTPAEDPDIPWVYCILSPDSTQWLELRYMSRKGAGDYRPIEEADILLSSHDTTTRRFNPVGHFTHVKNGRWKLDTMMTPGLIYQLYIITARGDTLTAQTHAPFEHLIVSPVISPGDSLSFEYTFHDGSTIHITNKYYDSGSFSNGVSSFFVRPDRTSYRLMNSDRSIEQVYWIYKTGYTPSNGRFLEETLATDREDLADDFNLTQACFTESTIPEALLNYPEVAGKPLHYRFLRIPKLNRQVDTLVISGDFTGVHYGYCDALMGGLIASHRAHIDEDRILGRYHDESACQWLFDNNEVGLVHFMTVSDEYDHYLRDIVAYELTHKMSTDVIGIYSNTNHYTNVKGGTGIFGAAIEIKQNWTCGVWTF